MAYPVAEILSQRGVPFAFVTGYEADTVEERFSNVPVLQKPIERQMLQKTVSYRRRRLPRRCGRANARRDRGRGATRATDVPRASVANPVEGGLVSPGDRS